MMQFLIFFDDWRAAEWFMSSLMKMSSRCKLRSQKHYQLLLPEVQHCLSCTTNALLYAHSAAVWQSLTAAVTAQRPRSNSVPLIFFAEQFLEISFILELSTVDQMMTLVGDSGLLCCAFLFSLSLRFYRPDLECMQTPLLCFYNEQKKYVR